MLHPTEDLSHRLLLAGDSALVSLNGATPTVGLTEVLFEILRRKDSSLVNLESPLTTRSECMPKTGPSTCSPLATAELLCAAWFDAVTMANNHIMDYEAPRLDDTVVVLRAKGIEHTGVGSNAEDARRPLIIDIGATSIAILAFAEEEFPCAKRELSGAARLDVVAVADSIREVKSRVDWRALMECDWNSCFARHFPG